MISATAISFIQRAFIQSVPLLYGSTGEIITEKGGNLNLGTAGVMYVGGISGVIGAFIYQNAVGKENVVAIVAILVTVLACIIGSLICGLIYSLLTVTFRANQNVTGLALTTFGVGVGNFFGGSLAKIAGTGTSVSVGEVSKCFKIGLPFADKLGTFGQIFCSYSFLAYFSIIVAIVASIYLRKTRSGLKLRAIGENPATADAAGVNVNRYKYMSVCVGSVIAGLGGLYYVMDYARGIWSNDGFGDRGWLAIALVIFALWKPALSIPGSFLFGALLIVFNYIQDLSVASQQLFKMAPYLVTIIILVVVSMRKKRENQPPQSLGLSYFREER